MEEIYNDMDAHIVTLLNEEGNEVQFDHLMTFFYEKEKYIALTPLEETDGIAEDEVLLLHVVARGDEDVYEAIESEALLEEAFNEFLEQFEEMTEGEE
ncbi:MAG: DUF1292 domain-containing protein [Clostridiales bacterium]|jgi:uncharacterized protein YrzB (UPF0473 family)|nr:DUF1292 domain-containing protein [Clostridiales bacterium]